MQNAGLYVHIPFCVQKCLYCDFLSYSNQTEQVSPYIDAVCKELEARGRFCKDFVFDTIFIGGGTPSCIEPVYIDKIIQKAKQVLNFTEFPEITLEMNPGTIREGMLKQYYEYGINRVSVGVQSTSDRLLKSIGRIHRIAAAYDTANQLHDNHFTNINFDFITGIPGISGEAPEDLPEVMENVEFVFRAGATHVSVYSMITEPGTPLYRLTESGQVTACDEELERLMYHEVRKRLTSAGFLHYEISNYALPGYMCRHNLKYWQCAPYLGVGLGSVSYLPSTDSPGLYIRRRNCIHLAQYVQNPLDKTDEEEILSPDERQKEYMMLGFRLLKGPDPDLYRKIFEQNMKKDFCRELDFLMENGLISDNLSLTIKGMDYANDIFRAFV